MSISEKFALKVSNISNDQEKLIHLMNDLDEEKRLIRSAQRKWSNSEKEEGGLSGSQRSNKLRKLKDKISFLIEEREYVKQKLANLKENKKFLNAAMNKKTSFVEAFYATAQINLSEEEVVELELKTYELLKEK